MNYTDLVTAQLSKKIPKSAVNLRFDYNAVWYLHRTKGWKRVSYTRMGLRWSGPKR